MKYEQDEYLRWDPFEGDESDLQCRTVRIVKVRKDHICYTSQAPGEDQHVIHKGELARFERALIDRSFWGRYYTCIKCMDKFLTELFGEDDE